MISAALRVEDKDFHSLGLCVYCMKPFSTDRLPTDEHIIGRSIGGRVEITNGACMPCARKTNNLYESAVSETTFFAYRLWAGLTANNARGLFNMAPGNALKSEIGDFVIPVTAESRPAIFSLPGFPPPLFWKHQQAYRHDSVRVGYSNFCGERVRIESGFFFEMNRRQRPQMEVRTYVKSETLDCTLRERHDMRGLLLMLAKIGYCFAVARLGFDAFDGGPIRSLLADERNDMATFVGGHDPLEDDLPKDSLHLLHLRERSGVVYVIVHLFASRGGPPFEVVVGTRP